MLSSVLPGVREVRNPLVSGSLWLAAAWLFLGHRYPSLLDGRHADPVLRRLYEFAGRGGAIAASTTIAVLVGSLSNGFATSIRRSVAKMYLSRHASPDSDWAVARASWLPRRVRDRLRFGRPLTTRAKTRAFYAGFNASLTARGVNPREAVDPQNVDASVLAAALDDGAAVVREVLFISPRLIVAKPELYVEFDRLIAEAELRDGLVVPAPFLAWQLARVAHLAGAHAAAAMIATALVSIALLLQADNRFREAHSLVAHSIAEGTIEAAAIHELRTLGRVDASLTALHRHARRSTVSAGHATTPRDDGASPRLPS